MRPFPLPVPDDVDPRALRVGFFVDDGVVSPSAACRRAIERAKAILEDAGVEVISYRPALCQELVLSYMAALSADGTKTLSAQVERDEIDKALTLLWTLARLPGPPRRAAGRGLSFLGETLVGGMLEVLGEKTVAELWRLTARAKEIEAEVFDAWNALGLDAVICPPHATPALPDGKSRDFTLAGALSMRFNLLDFPAEVVPVTRVRASEAHRPNPQGRLERRAAEVDRGCAGLPLGVQVAARPYREEGR